MPAVDLVVESEVSTSVRARQVCSMFDAPPSSKCRLEWRCEMPIETFEWNVGLIVGPSGAGKTSIMRHVFGEMPPLAWSAASVVDDFDAKRSVEEIAAVCSAVGFNTIPAWMRPYAVLSNGEKFRVDLARRLLEVPDPIVVDEFTSVVDRQVAKIGSHAVQKHVRRLGKKFVAVTCHYDVIEWLQPDWVLDVATRSFTRRSLQRRPDVECVVGRVPYSAWSLFAPFHYLTADLHRAAQCFGLWCDGQLAAFAGVLHQAHSRVRDIKRISRVVTLPDYQGLGLAFALIDRLGAAYKAVGMRLRNYPAHPAFVRAHDRSKVWRLEKKPGVFSAKTSASSTVKMSGRPCAVFEYCGPSLPISEAQALLAR